MGATGMSNLPNSVIRLVPPTLRGGYCPDSWTEFARTIVGGTSAQVNLDRGHTFYNFGNVPVFPTPETPQGPCGGCGEQDNLIDWDPAGIDLNEIMTFRFNTDFCQWDNQPQVSRLCFNQTTHQSLYYVEKNQYVTEILFPNLVTANQIMIINCDLLEIVDLSQLQTAAGVAYKSYDTSYPNIAIEVGTGCPVLSEIRLGSSFSPTNGKTYYFQGAAMPASNIDEILCIFAAAISYTSGILTVLGSEPPSAAGYACKATIQARGVTVNTI